MDSETEKTLWSIVAGFFNSRHLNQNKLHPYNKCVSEALPKIVENVSPIIVQYGNEYHCFELLNYHMNKPVFTEHDGEVHTLSPTEARLRSLTMASESYVNILYHIFVDKCASEKGKTTSKQRNGPVRKKQKFNDLTNYTWNDIKTKCKEIHCQLFGNIRLWRYPVMVNSILCHSSDGENPTECVHDDGGYFIIQGEKSLMYRERLAFDQCFCFKTSTNQYEVEVRSSHLHKYRSTSTCYMKLAKRSTSRANILVMRLPVKRGVYIPWVLLMRCVGIKTDKDIWELFKVVVGPKFRSVYAEYIIASLKENVTVWTQTEALRKIGEICGEKTEKGQLSRGLATINRELLPHLGTTPTSFYLKAWYLCYMAGKLIDATERPREGLDDNLEQSFYDKDSYFNKRIETQEELLAGLTRQHLNINFIPHVRNMVIRHLEKNKPLLREHLQKIFGEDKVGQGISSALATGIWHATKGKPTQTGVSQRMDTLNFMSTQAQHTKIINHLSKQGNHIAPRLLHNTSFGVICPFASVDGQECGLIKNITPTTIISVGRDPRVLCEILRRRLPLLPVNKKSARALLELEETYAHVFVNGRPLGVCRDADLVVSTVRQMRRNFEISYATGVSFRTWNYIITEIHIRCDSGRFMRPLLVIENWHKVKELSIDETSWHTLMEAGIVEYVDIEEQSVLYIAENIQHEKCRDPHYTHAELHGALSLGISACTIPFLNNNQAPRNTYQCIMGKQAQGINSSIVDKRMDTTRYSLWYPQRPIVETKLPELLAFHKLPAGQHVDLVIMSLDGGNQEDALIVNRNFIDFGALRSWVFGTVTAKERRMSQHCTESFGRVYGEKCISRKRADYSNIGTDGLAEIGTAVKSDSIIMNRSYPTTAHNTFSNEVIHRDTSILMKSTEHGVIDKVMKTNDDDGMTVCKVQYRKTCIAEIGDKFSPRHGQKGTIGAIKNPEDLPFAMDGFIPNIVINGLAFTRMTYGLLFESLLGVLCCQNGMIGNGTPFSKSYQDFLYRTRELRMRYFRDKDIVEDLGDALKAIGLHPHGNSRFISGITGNMIEGSIFRGVTYYQKLKHQVGDKIRARARGKTHIQTRQPTEGRKDDGALKFGEMESDCLKAHGASALINERLFESTDPWYLHTCKRCNNTSIYAEVIDNPFCSVCEKFNTSCQTHLPCGFKKWKQDLMAVGAHLKLH